MAGINHLDILRPTVLINPEGYRDFARYSMTGKLDRYFRGRDFDRFRFTQFRRHGLTPEGNPANEQQKECCQYVRVFYFHGFVCFNEIRHEPRTSKIRNGSRLTPCLLLTRWQASRSNDCVTIPSRPSSPYPANRA